MNTRSSLSPLVLLGILASWIALVSIIRPTRKPNKNCGKADHPENTTADPGDSAPRQPTTIAQVPPSPSDSNNANGRKNDAPLWEKLAATAVAIGTLGLLLINIFLWSSTKKAADAAKDSVNLARKNAHFDQRAWLAISYGKLHFMVGQPFDFPVEIVDTGKTPAKGIQGQMVTLFLSRTDRLEFNYDRGTSLEIGTMLPNEPHHAPSWLIATKLAPREKIAALPISKQMADAIRSGEAYVVVYGRLSYRSVFGTEHWIHFCGLNEQPMQFSQKECTEYNDVDDNEEK